MFKQKKDQLLKDLAKGGIFGKVIADMYVIEFQKRGLPHAHILIILAEQDRAMTAEGVESVITAELPPSPDTTEDPEKKEQRSRLEEIVLRNMVHGPCGAENPSAPCSENFKCTCSPKGGKCRCKCQKGYPKDYQYGTIVDGNNFYATYHRRAPEDGG